MKDRNWTIEVRHWSGEDFLLHSRHESETLSFFDIEQKFRIDRVSVFPFLKEVTVWVSELPKVKVTP